jgi:DNA-directed RNA polymerase specialized sigma24 family protein
MLGSLGEADDAVQEAWLRLGRADAGAIDNLDGWLTTVVSRVCLDMLRSRQSQGEESLDDRPENAPVHVDGRPNPEGVRTRPPDRRTRGLGRALGERCRDGSPAGRGAARATAARAPRTFDGSVAISA